MAELSSNNKPVAQVEVTAKDLQGPAPGVVFCPNPKMPLWSNHPRIFLDLSITGTAKCSYCGTVYALKAGETLGHRH